jgi:hypothetical protein
VRDVRIASVLRQDSVSMVFICVSIVLYSGRTACV